MVILKIFNEDSSNNEAPLTVLNVGEHILGRNSIEDWKTCKSISRSHINITVEESQASLQLVHVNPIYFISIGSGTERTLTKDSSVKLEDGDKFAFSKELWYRFEILKKARDQENSIEYSSKSDSGIITVPSGTSNNTQTSPLKRSLEELNSEGRKKLKTINQSLDVLLENINSIKQQDFDAGSSSNPDENKGCDNDTNDKTTVEVFRKKDVSDSDEQDSDVDMADVTKDSEVVTQGERKTESVLDCDQRSSKHTHDTANSSGDDAQTDLLKEPMECKSDKNEEIKGEPPEENVKEKVSDSNNDSLDGLAGSKSPDQGDTNVDPVKQETSASTSGENTCNMMRREQCWYGGGCYRKSREHREEFSHPGDSDYDRDSSSDDRPECSYGAQCYRTNVAHRKQYKHPASRPAPKPSKQGTVRYITAVLGCPHCKHCRFNRDVDEDDDRGKGGIY